jgi:hypothetical protein
MPHGTPANAGGSDLAPARLRKQPLRFCAQTTEEVLFVCPLPQLDTKNLKCHWEKIHESKEHETGKLQPTCD